MNVKKVVCCKLKHPDLDLLGKRLKKYKNLQLVEVSSFDELNGLNIEEVAAIFLYLDESTHPNELESYIKDSNKKSINIILKNKNFDLLMLCYKHNVTSVFEQELNSTYLDRVLIQIDLLAKDESADVPVGPVIDLFSSPVKVKTDQELYSRLTGYFSHFDGIEFFNLIKKNSDGTTNLGGSAQLDWNRINFPQTSDNFIGEEFSVSIGDENFLLSPLLTSESESLWLAIKVIEDQKSYILNELFYKYLENVHIYRMNKEKEQNLFALATTDDVTGLYNQRKLSQDLAAAVEYHEKTHKTFSIMFIDVDHFKSVNDNYGHVIGSKLLVDIGDVLSQILRASDDIYRYGGDEFVVIMPSVDIKTVHEIATRVLNKIKTKKFDIGEGKEYQLSVSIGIAEYPTDATSATQIIQFADEMMYKSKNSGRGKVFHVKEV